MLPLYDHTADLALFLCDGAAAGRGAVARAVVPLTQLLPRNPLRKPPPMQAWVALFPLGAEGDPAGSCELKNLPYISPTLPLHFLYISPTSPIYLPTSPLHLPGSCELKYAEA